jgi:hypothetical protein
MILFDVMCSVCSGIIGCDVAVLPRTAVTTVVTQGLSLIQNLTPEVFRINFIRLNFIRLNASG